MTEEINKGCEFQSDCIEYKDISYLKVMPICAIHELSIACHDKVNKCKYYKLYKQLKQAENTVNECHKYLAELEDKIERLEQERDELKKTVENQKLEYEELQCDLSEVENACGCYQSENAELKQENKDLNFKINQLKANGLYNDLTGIELCAKVVELEQENKELKELNKKICEDWEKEIKVYWNTLEEIKAISDNYNLTVNKRRKQIADKIDEVLNLS